MEVKNYIMWESTRGDGVEEEEYDVPDAVKFIVSIPSGEVITVNNVIDFNKLSQKKLIIFYKFYKGAPLSCFCCVDEDASKIKYLLDEYRQEENKKRDFKPIAREYREKLKKVTRNSYTITYNKSAEEFIAIVPDINTFSQRERDDFDTVCIEMTAKYKKYDFDYKARSKTYTGIDYLRIDD